MIKAYAAMTAGSELEIFEYEAQALNSKQVNIKFNNRSKNSYSTA